MRGAYVYSLKDIVANVMYIYRVDVTYVHNNSTINTRNHLQIISRRRPLSIFPSGEAEGIQTQ